MSTHNALRIFRASIFQADVCKGVGENTEWGNSDPEKIGDLQTYSGGHLRFYGKNVSFCLSPTNDITETNKVPLKSPFKILPELQKKFWIFQNLLDFRALQCF